MKYLKLKFLLMFFALAMAIPPAWASVITFDLSTAASTNGTKITTLQQGAVTLTFSKGNGSTDPALYDGAVRIYSEGYLGINCPTYKITAIEFTGATASATTNGGLANWTPTSGDYEITQTSSPAEASWTGYVNYVEFNVAKSKRVYPTKVVVTIDDGNDQEQVEKPTIMPNGGTFTSPQDVTISCATDGATISYSTDGVSWTNGNSLTVSESCTVYAKATKTGWIDSDVAEAEFVINTSQGGVVYELLTNLNQLQDGKKVIITSKGVAGDASAMGAQQTNNFKGTSITITSDVTITDPASAQILTLEGATGAWYFRTSDNKYLYAASSSSNNLKTQDSKTDDAKATIVINSSAGNTQVTFQGNNTRNRLRYNSGSDLFSCYSEGQQNIFLYVEKDGGNRVATPTFDPAGGSYDTPQSVTISCTTDGATIHYTTDGTEPTEASTQYTGAAIEVNETTTIKAIAVADDMEDSYVATATYTLPKFVSDFVTANGLADNTNFAYTKRAVVVYVKGSNMWIQDENATAGGGYVYTSGLNFAANDVIEANWKAKKETFSQFPEFTGFEGSKVVGDGNTQTPVALERSTLNIDNFAEYVLLKNVTISTNSDNLYVSLGRADYQLYTDKLGLNTTFAPEDGKTYNVKGIVGGYQGNLQIYPIEITEYVAPGNPSIEITAPETLPFNDEGGVYTVNASYLPDGGLGVSVSDGFSRYLINGHNDPNYYFDAPYTEGTGHTVTNGQTRVNYTGREFSATGTITYASQNATQSENLSYRSDVYIYGDFGNSNGWGYLDNEAMSYDGSKYTKTFTVDKDSYFIFARKTGESYNWDTNRLFFGAKTDGRNWVYTSNTTDDLDLNGIKNYGDDNNVQYHCIEIPAGEYTITIDPTTKKFTIEKVVHQVEKPVISPEGGEYNTIQTVTITCVDGATIHYTTNGDVPDENSSVYGEPITVDKTMTIKAIAVMNGMTNSEVAEATYTLPTSVNTLAAANALAAPTEFLFTGDAVVTYHNGDYTFLRDVNATAGGGLIYQSGINLAQGVVLKKGWDAKRADYRGEKEYINAINVENSGSTADYTPFDRTGVPFADAHMNEYVTFNNVTITGKTLDEGSGKYTYTGTYTEGNRANVDYILHNQFDLNNIEEGRTYNVTGVVTKRDDNMQVYPTAVTLVQQDPKLAYSAETASATFGVAPTNLPTLTKPADLTVTYESSNTAVATVDENGEVSIVGVGTAIIKASNEENTYYLADEASYTLTVGKADAVVEYSAENATATFGAEATLPTLTVSPNDLEVTYSSTNTAVATVGNDGKVAIVGVGTTTISAAFAGNNNYNEASDSYVLTVTPAGATFTYSAPTATATYGVEATLPTLNNPNGLTVTYTSSNPEVATVDADGKVTIKGAGKTVITANGAATGNYGTATASYTLTVNKADLEVSFNNETPDPITIGDNFTAPVLSEVPEGTTVTYKSSNENVAKVNATTGEVEIVGVGSAIITATVTGANYNETSASYTITVNDVVVALAAPTFAPAAGTYTEPKEVAIACATPGVTIEYTIDGVTKTYDGPFMVDRNCIVTATAKMGTRTVYTPATAEAQYTINAAAAAEIADNYYYLQNNALSDKYANVAGRRTLNFVGNADEQAGTVFRVETGEGGAVKTLRSQAVDLQGYAKRAMAYVGPVVQMVINKLNDMSGVDDATGTGNILGNEGLEKILAKFNECFDYNLYVEGTEGAYRIYARTPSMQNVVDFYNDPANNSQIKEKLPMLEGYINQVLDKIRAKVVSAGMNGSVIEPFSLVKVWEQMGGQLIKPEGDNVMAFYDQVLTNKEYVWDFAYQTAMIYLNNIKQTETYGSMIPAEYQAYIEKMQRIRPETKYYMIQYGNEPDYVSENNVKIIGNDPSTYWTLTPRENFTVNVPEANKLNDSYYTTLYTDFAYTLPEGVTAYAVTDIDDNDVAQLAELSSPIAAQTPVLLKANAAGTVNVTLTTAAGNTPETNLLEGPDYLVKTYGITSPTVEAIFNLAAAFVPADMLAEYEYLKLRTSGTVNNKYFWNVNDALEKLTDDCVVRSLAVKDGTLAFSEHWTTETNKAFLVSDTKPVIYLEKETLAAPTFSPVPGSYTVNNGESVTITITAEDGATIYYKIGDGEYQRYNGPITASDDMTIVAKAEKDGMIASDEVTAVYVIDIPAELPDVPAMKGYYQIMNNGNEKYAHVQGRKTLTFTDAPADKAGTVIWLETNEKGQVQSLRSQAADLQRYADRAVEYYVPKAVELVVEKLHADGEGNILGENGLDAIMDKFNKSFDHHLYVEEAQGGYRIYGKTPSMQPVVDFYREHTAQVEAKLPMLEDFINSALNKLKEKIGGSSVFTPFSLLNIWERMGGTLTKPENDASIMAFYREVLNNKNYVWDFAYQTATFYLENLKNHERWPEVEAMMGEYAQYFNKLEQVRPDFKYYIVADGDKPDFISEGNVDINNNAARTIWTVEPRTTFTVNVPENNKLGGGYEYVTTLYTDFAYDLPEGVTAYKVTGVTANDVAELEAIEGTIPAQTPVLLKATTAGDKVLTLNVNDGTIPTDNLLVGPDFLINYYDLTTPQLANLFQKLKEKLGEDFYNSYVKDYEYLMKRNSGTVNNKYFWNVNADLDKMTDEPIVRDLAVDENGKLAFSDHWTTENNKAFLVDTLGEHNVIYLSLRGDINRDGLVNISDVTALIDILLELEPYSFAEPSTTYPRGLDYEAADVNLSGARDITDVTVLIDIILSEFSQSDTNGN